ncbi:PAS domain-containing sensor histidine kinase [Alishewanella longhuensis]|uniref:PAS domain-containing sensor histidine kinase n=1 Tax=Alishewanella longhuensis TaxID=1091037 RepID=UPI0016768152|nr:PAS domain-containing sensor histidine kinase [Alishewanella longhuensis]
MPRLNAELLEFIPAAALRVDAFGYVLALNALAQRLDCNLVVGQPMISRLDALSAHTLVTILSGIKGAADDVCEFEASIGQRFFRIAAGSHAYQDGSRIVQLTDISEYRSESDRIFESEQYYRSLFTENPEAVFGLSTQGQFLNANQSMWDLTGYNEEDLLQSSWEQVVAEEDRAIVTKNFQKTLEGTATNYRCSIISREGKSAIVEITHIPIFVNDRVVGVFGIARDRTEYYRVAENRRMLRAAIAQIQDVIIITETNPLDDPGPSIVFVNEPVKEMTGYEPEELMGKSPRILQGPETDPAVLRRIRAALEAKQPIKEELINYCKDGKPYWNEIEIVPIVAKDIGQGEYFASVQRDITESKRQQMKLLQTQRELRLLNKAQDTIIERERRRIARDLHDDLGQTLTAMKLDLSLALRDVSHLPKAKLNRLQAMIDYIDDVIERVRDIAANLRPAMLDDLGFEATAEWFLKQYSGRDDMTIHWHAELASNNNPQAKGDVATTLFRILQECMTNIIRHAKATTVWVHYEETDKQAQLCVKDDGVGFNKSKLKSTGLGLVSMRERVVMHDGQLTVNAVIGQGTEILVSLPLGNKA